MRTRREVARRSVAAACAGAFLVVAGCTPSPDPVASPTSDLFAEELPVPAVSAPPDAKDAAEPAPQISVQITTEAPNPPDDGGSGTQARVEASVTEASASYASTLVALANASRADAGLSKLSVDGCAASAARARALRALALQSLRHEALPKCGSGWRGENLARHYGSPHDMHAAWMASPGHRANILRPEFTGIGVGCVAYSHKNAHLPATSRGDVGGHVCSEVFVG